jgi:quercetin dioxygenase-like cupin family protein
VTDIAQAFAAEGLEPQTWSNAPNDTYDWHEHSYHKVLYCVRGSITFHLRDGDRELSAGDRLDIPARTSHAATIGPDGVECMEAAKRD